MQPRPFWEMQYRLIDLQISMKEHAHFVQPVNALLVKPFSRLGYASPKEETQLLLLLVDAFWKREIVQGTGSTRVLCDLMKRKDSDQHGKGPG